jgi:hypothetical protein
MTQASTERVHILLAAGALDSESLVTGQFLDGADLSEKSLVIFGAGGDRITTSETRDWKPVNDTSSRLTLMLRMPSSRRSAANPSPGASAR